MYEEISFHKDTPKAVKRIIYDLVENGNRVRFWYGENGVAWAEENDVMGTVGRSWGTKHVPILLKNVTSVLGSAILDHCIVKIVDIKTRRVLYQHPKFDVGNWELKHVVDIKLPCRVYFNGETQAAFDTDEKANRYIAFMIGSRFSK